MTDLDVDQGTVEDNQGFLSIKSPFLHFQFNLEETIEEYVNCITSVVVEDVELHLGIHDLQEQFHSETHVHPNLEAHQLLAPSQDKNIEVKCDPQ